MGRNVCQNFDGKQVNLGGPLGPSKRESASVDFLFSLEGNSVEILN
jgi:hypothetical protein